MLESPYLCIRFPRKRGSQRRAIFDEIYINNTVVQERNCLRQFRVKREPSLLFIEVLNFWIRDPDRANTSSRFPFLWGFGGLTILLQWRVWSWLRMNASYRLNTCKSRGSGAVAIRPPATGARVSNTYPTFRPLGNSLSKERLMPDGMVGPHGPSIKDLAVVDGDALH